VRHSSLAETVVNRPLRKLRYSSNLCQCVVFQLSRYIRLNKNSKLETLNSHRLRIYVYVVRVFEKKTLVLVKMRVRLEETIKSAEMTVKENYVAPFICANVEIFFVMFPYAEQEQLLLS